MTVQPTLSAKKVALQNVGCKLNLYEIEALKNNFSRQGFAVVPFDTPADIYVVNTCTVTGAGDADSRKAIRRARRANPSATIVATGCYAQRRPDEMRSSGADLVVGNGQKADLLRHLEDHLSGVDPSDFDPEERPRTSAFLEIDGVVADGRTRGTLQIQDGCDEHCTYCIIPSVRGSSISRPHVQIMEQARRMVDDGYRELALTGVHSGSYGYDRESPKALVELLTDLEDLDGLSRIRLNSIEPNFVSDLLIDFAASSTKLCRHFHIPLQSGDDAILRRMGRHYTRAHYADRIERIAAAVPDCALGADVMVGFPGEGEEQFTSTFSLLADLPMTYLHVFPFSLRAGTPAERLKDHQTPQTKKERSGRLIRLGLEKRRIFHHRFIDRTLEVLVEDRSDAATGLSVGLTDNYIKVLFAGGDELANRLVNVRITRARQQLVFGELESIR